MRKEKQEKREEKRKEERGKRKEERGRRKRAGMARRCTIIANMCASAYAGSHAHLAPGGGVGRGRGRVDILEIISAFHKFWASCAPGGCGGRTRLPPTTWRLRPVARFPPHGRCSSVRRRTLKASPERGCSARSSSLWLSAAPASSPGIGFLDSRERRKKRASCAAPTAPKWCKPAVRPRWCTAKLSRRAPRRQST